MKRLFKYLKPYRFLAVVSPLMMMGEVVADLSLPFLMSFIVDYGIVDGGMQKIPDGGFVDVLLTFLYGADFSRLQLILTLGGLMLLITLVGGFFGTFCAYTSATAAQGFGHDLRKDLYRRVMSLSIEQTDKFTTGSLVTRLTNDVSMVIEFIEMITRHFVRAPIFFIGGTVMLLSLNLKYGVILLFSLPLLAVTLTLVLTKAIPMFSVVQKKLDKVNSVVQENVNGSRVVKAYVCEEFENTRFGKANDDLCSVNYRVLKLMAVIMPVLTVVQNGAVIALIAVGGVDLSNGVAGMSTGTVMAGVTYVTQVVGSIMMATMMFQSISRAMASGKRVSEILDTLPVITDGKTEDVPPAPVAVSFRHVSFRYPGTVGAPVLSDINLDVKKGETLAVIGATGCGKTSLVSLIPRFYDATEGTVEVDGVPVKDYRLGALRKKIGCVLQKSELFAGTVRENILWGDPEASDEIVETAAKTAQAEEFIQTLHDGYEGRVTEKGTSLSGGQKQRLSIARALARKPEILIFDDSTSALDLATEAKLQSAMREYLRDTTVILIAQRIASVRHADRIAVLDGGTLVGCGSHDELLRTCPAYREICRSQLKQTEIPDLDAEGGAAV